MNYNNYLCKIDDEKVKDRIIVVGSVRTSDAVSLKSYIQSNFSSDNGDRVDVYAPGENIYSTVPTDYDASGYEFMSGTSMASPFVAGLAGLIWEANPNLTPEEIKQIIIETAHPNYPNLVDAEAAVKRATEELRHSKIVFVANGGSGTMESVDIKLDNITAEYTLPECTFTPPVGYEFKCWSFNDMEYAPGDAIKVKCSYKYVFNNTTDSYDLHLSYNTVTAVWEEVPSFRFVFDANGGFGIMEDAVVIVEGNSGYTLPECGFIHLSGQTFKAWRIGDKEYAPGDVYPITESGSVTVYAVWNYVELDHGEIVDSGEFGENVTWTFYENGTLVISGTGDMKDYYRNSYLPYQVYVRQEKITSAVISKGVTSIGNYAFSGCRSLTSVTIGNSVTSIGEGAFYDCSSLMSVTIPNSVTSIGNSAFSKCSSLTSVTIPNSVTSIGESAFSYCSSLTSATIPDSVTSIGNYAFTGCSSLTSVTIPNSVTSIGNAAFYDCSSLMSVTIPNSVTSIGNYTFNGCRLLTSITIPNSVISIGERAFCFCVSLTSVTIPNSVIVIGISAFRFCSSLTSVTIGNSVTYIETEAFYNCTSLTSVTIPNSVISIRGGAFSNCNSLTSVTIGNSVTYIETEAFYKCTSLTSVTIPNSVTSIGNYAFRDCTSLTSIRFKGSALSFGSYAFYRVTATAYYPAGDPTWTEDVRQNYGGTITWVAYNPADFPD